MKRGVTRPFAVHTAEVYYALSKAASMSKPAPITIPTEPIGGIPRPVDLIKRVAKGDSENPSLPALDRHIEAPVEVQVRSFAAWQADGGAWLP